MIVVERKRKERRKKRKERRRKRKERRRKRKERRKKRKEWRKKSEVEGKTSLFFIFRLKIEHRSETFG